jgi:hypothetical protein
MSTEEMTTSPTGGDKSRKLARFDLLPPYPLTLLAEHFGRATKEHGGKYDDRNWEKGYAWSLCFGALQRHAWAFWGREDIDPDTGSPHLIAVAWHALALVEFSKTHPEYDDRSFPDPQARTREIEERFEQIFSMASPIAPDCTGADLTQ